MLNAEGDWEVASKPDWCELSQMSGSKKTELTLTIKQMASGSEMREGEIVFRLKDKDYTHSCTVRQYDYQYREDEIITMQKATRGNNGGINIVIVGDGYDAKDMNIRQELLMPYVETELLSIEMMNLEFEVRGGFIRVFEQRSGRKDRYVSFAMANFLARQLELKHYRKDKKQDISKFFKVHKGNALGRYY